MNGTEQYLAEVSRIILANFRPTDPATQSMTAARAGLLVRQVTRCSPIQGGFAKFADVLRELDRWGVIRVIKNSKDALAICLPEEKLPVSDKPSPISADSAATPFRRLLNSVWLAFIAESPAGRRFMHKRSGEIRRGQENKPEPSDEWVEIDRVDQSAEMEDAKAFLRAEGWDNNEQLKREFESPTWYRDFSTSLLHIDSFLALKWKRRRSSRVVGRVEQWRKANGIPAELVYENPAPPVSAQTVVAAAAANATASDKDARIRDAIISAIRQMRTDELLELRVPAKHLVNALRPDFSTR